jgi:Asp-tRNA(Asn)/Glu-tRNA(Gln) amidotransferase A subunit family amidase
LYASTSCTPERKPTAHVGQTGLSSSSSNDYIGGAVVVKVGVFWDWFADGEAEVMAECSAAMAALQALGAQVVNVTIPHMRWLGECQSGYLGYN